MNDVLPSQSPKKSEEEEAIHSFSSGASSPIEAAPLSFVVCHCRSEGPHTPFIMDGHTSHHKRECKEDKRAPLVPTFTPLPTDHHHHHDALPTVFLKQKRIVQLPLYRSIPNLSPSSLFDTNKSNSSDGSSAAKYNNGWDDENFDYIVTPGDVLDGRYRIKECIGKGSFGQVVRAVDMESSSSSSSDHHHQAAAEVAIKIIKSNPPFLKQAESEIELLTLLREKDPDDQHNIGTYDQLERATFCFIKYETSALTVFPPISLSRVSAALLSSPYCTTTDPPSATVDSFHASQPPVPSV
jgi:hypothetical protein